MAEASQYAFSYREVVEALIKKQGVHDGLWALNVRFGMQATNFGPNETDVKPTVIIPILEIGIQKVDKENTLTVDAAKVNPAPVTARISARTRPS
jgi:hypothetical protein